MSDQPEALTLFDVVPDFAPFDPTITDRFESFHMANPWVYEALARLARDMKNRGRTRIGIAMLFEVLRWDWLRATQTVGDFKLNNNFKSRYARLLMEREPDLADLFAVRELKAA